MFRPTFLMATVLAVGVAALPSAEVAVRVRAGEYLLAVRGQDVRGPANLYSFFENTAGKIIEITVGPNPDGSASRTAQVVPIASESTL